MKRIKILLFALCLFPCVSHAASSEFMVAAQLLSAAKNADIQQVQSLINAGADVNFVDSTGLSIVCTALMNNDLRAAQILQMYGADASRCDRQIKQYKNRTEEPKTGGLFSGLSSAHGITLAAAGAAVVVGGLLLLTDVFDGSGGGGSNSNSNSGNRPGTGEGGGGASTGTAAFTIPYGPAMPNAELETQYYAANLDLYSSDENETYKTNFDLMNIYGGRADASGGVTGGQNYLLMMHGYSPLARGYLGMRTLRNNSNVPLDLAGNNLGSDAVMGGLPVNVAMVTKNGINSTDENSLANKFLIWTTVNNNNEVVNGASNSMISSKYYNNAIVLGDDNSTIDDDTVVETESVNARPFDLAGYGTAIHNVNATASDNRIAQVTGGNTDVLGSLMGFMPNGQMSIFRTGGGVGLVAMGADDVATTGTYTMAGEEFATGDEITLNGKTLAIVRNGNAITATETITEEKETTNEDGETVTETVTTDVVVWNGYIGTDGMLYLNSTVGGDVDMAFNFTNGNLTQVKKQGIIDYQNWAALRSAAQLGENINVGRAISSVVANASVIEPLHSVGAATINTVLAPTQDEMKTGFTAWVNEYYDLNPNDGLTPGTDAVAFFNGLGSSYSPLTIFSTGAFDTGNSSYASASQIASFENAAPLAFDNLEHLFMSVVAVGLSGNGTTGESSVSGFSPSGKYALSQWYSNNGTSDITSDDKYYKSRVCGIAGAGANGIDPWCFAAAGITDELAVSAAAGAAGVLKSAFSYLNNKQIFALMALTADGAYLATDADGTAFSKEGLTSYLQSMYILPSDYQNNGKDYLENFKEVYGYGLINLERATTPGKSIYFYDGTNIVSSSGNAYWRAAQNTTFRSSAVFSPRAATISAPFFDVLTSIDGELSMPRVWQNEFSLGTSSRRALYMGDTLADLHTRDVTPDTVSVGNIELSLSISDRAYADEFGGLDNMNVRFTNGNWELNAGYQHYQTDGASRFSGMSNPIFGLATNAVNTSAKYKFGNWALGMRAMSGLITDEGLLENDPTISSQYAPAHLGQMMGVGTDATWSNGKFSVAFGMGHASETDTLLGAQTDGLLSMGNGETTYVESAVGYKFTDNISLRARATVARTDADANGQFILGLSDIWSDSVAVSADVGNFNFSISRPLAVTRGAMKYAYADYDVVEHDGKYELAINDTHVADVSLRPDNRELRMMASYQHNFGEFTDGALGLIYRVNPNNTHEFGNESIFMMKLTHRIGI